MASTASTGKSAQQEIISREAWLAFMDAFGDTEPLSLNDIPLTEAQKRSCHRWRCEGADPSVWTIDRLLVSVGLHLDTFLTFCEHEGISPWKRGHPPDWEHSQREPFDPLTASV